MEIAQIMVSGIKAELPLGKGERWEIPAGIIGASIRFTFGPEWEGLMKTVVFQGCDQTKDVVGVENEVTVPAEVVSLPEEKLRVGVYGVDADGNTATPTLWVEGFIKPGAAPSGDTTVDGTLPVWAQLDARLSALEEEHVEIDASLTEAGYAADAKEVGDRFAALVPLGYLEIDDSLTKSAQAADAKAVGDALAGKLSTSGGTVTGAIAMSGNKVTGLGDPTEDGDAVSLGYANGAYALASNLSSLKSGFLSIPAASSVKFSVDSHLLMVGRMQVAECTSPAVYAISAYSAIRAPVVAELSAGTYITVATGGDNTDGWFIEVSNTRTAGNVSLYFIGSTAPTILS